MVVHYDPFLVVLSVVVAALASYTALTLAGSLRRATGRARAVWLTGGSIAMGLGIWSMHFIGMLAFSMPGMTMGYDLPLMVLSILIAIGASALALWVVSREEGRVGAYPFAGLAMGVAIAGMHYVGMASMRMDARIEWNYWLVALSVLIAVGASFGALWISFRLRRETPIHPQIARALAALVMGFAISGMHYTGMLAANFVHAGDGRGAGPDVIANSSLTAFVVVTTFLILAFTLFSSVFDRALARRTAMADESARLFYESERALASVQEEREIRERFVSSLTHDLRTPLTAARLNAQLMTRQLQNPEKIHELSAKVIAGLERADGMIRDLLDAHRIGAHQALPLNVAAVDLGELVRETIGDLVLVHGERFVVRTDEDVRGWWDAQYVRRMLENLLSNAVKYGYSQTPVTVRVERVDRNALRVSVHNYGEAMPESERKNLFQLFHRLKSAESSGAKGWGIGLTLVKGVAEAHGGSVRVESEARKGTTFVVDLPADARPSVRARECSPAPESGI